MAKTTKGELKQLGFVPTTVSAGVKQAEAVVNYTNARLPKSVKPTVEKVEQEIAARAGPLLSVAASKGGIVLESLDAQVDNVVQSATKVYNNQLEFHAQNLEQFKAAREASLEKVRALIEYLKEKGLSSTLRSLVDAAAAQFEKVKSLPSYATEQAQAALAALHAYYEQLLSNPTVTKLLSAAKPTVDFAVTKYLAAHDAVVASGSYKYAYSTSMGVFGYVTSTSAFKRVYPFFAPYADPALQSQYAQLLLEHVKPMSNVH